MRRTVVAVICAVLMGVLVLLAVAHLPFVRARVFAWAKARIAQTSGIRVEADRVDYNLLTASIVLANPALNGEGSPPFFRADRIRVGLSRSLFWGNIRVERLALERPRVVIVRRRDGTTNLPTAPTETPSSTASPLRLGLVEVKALTLEIDDQSAGRTLEAGPIDLTFDTNSADTRGNTFGPGAFTVGLGGTTASSPARTLAGTAAGRLGFDGTRLSIPALHVETPEGRLTLNGWIDLLADVMNVSAEGQIDLNLATANRFANLPDPLAGSLRAQFTLGGALPDPTVRLDLNGERLTYRPIANATLSGRANYSDGRIGVEAFHLASPVGELSMSGVVQLRSGATATETSQIAARFANLDLDPLFGSSGVRLPLPLGSTASGDLALTLVGREPFGPDWLSRLTGRGTAHITSSGAGASVSGQLDLSVNALAWTIAHTLQSTTGQASLTGRISGRLEPGTIDVARSTLAGSSRLRVDDLGAARSLLQRAGVHLPPAIDRRLGGTLNASLELQGTIGAPSVLANVTGRAIQLADSPAGEVDSTLVIDTQRVRARSLEARLGAARLTVSGDYGWRGQIDAQFALASDDVGALARIADVSAVALAGSGRLDGSIQGATQSPRVRGRLSARDLSVEATPIGPLTATLDLEKSLLTFDAHAADLNLQLKGNLDTGEPLAYRAEVVLDSAPVARLIPANLRPSIPVGEGSVTANMSARGVLRRPLESAGELRLQTLDVVVSDIPIRLEGPATVILGPDLFSSTPLQLRAGKQTRLRLQGALARAMPREGLQLNVDATIAELLELGAASIPDWPLSAGASRVNIDVRVGGTLSAPEPNGTISVQADALRYADLPPVNAVELSARIERDQIAVQSLTAAWQQARLLAEATVPLRLIVPEKWLASLSNQQRPATLRARVVNLTPEVLASFIAPSDLGELAGTAAATITGEADAFSIDQVRASVVIDELSLALAEVPFAQSVPTRIRLEDGVARVESFRWNAQGNEIAVSGSANLTGPDLTLDLAAVGNVDLRVLGAFTSDIAAGGVARADVAVRGLAANPEIVGSIGITDGELRIVTPPLAASDFDGRIAIAADRTGTIDLKGLVNGGSTTVAGNLDLKDWTDARGRVVLTASNVSLDYPDGFQTESNADLTLTLAGPGSSLIGRLDVLNGTYREPIVLSRGLVAGFTGSDTAITMTAARSFLETLRLDVQIASAEPVRVDNNYAALNLEADLRVTGTAERPGAIGRITALPDGEIYLLGNTYRVQTLIVDLQNPTAIAPDLTFLAETRVNNIPIEVALQCASAGACERDVRSQAVGITNEQAESMLFGVSTDPADAGTQLARLLSGEVLGIVGRTVGLDTLRLEVGATSRSELFDDPTLLAGDVNPASRLTFGKRLGDRVELAYSQDLADNGFTTSTSFFAPAGITLRALLFDDQSRSYEFHHEPRFGRSRRPEPMQQPRPSVASIRIAGNPGLAEDELRRRLRLTEGDRYDFETWQNDRERLQALYRSHGFFEATVRTRRVPAAEGEIALEYTINRGPRTELVISGAELPDAVRNLIIDRWTGAIFDGFLERDITLIVREHLYRDGRLLAQVSTAMHAEDGDDLKTLRVDINPGPAMTPRLEFEGNSLIATPRLAGAAQGAGPLAAWLDPAFLTLVIERLYREQGLLSAKVDVLKPETRDSVSIVRVVVREGEAWRIRRVTLGGDQILQDEGVLDEFQVTSGARYDPRLIAAQVSAVEQQARAAGFVDVRAVVETVLDENERAVDVHVLAAAGPRSVLSSVVVEGARADDRAIADNVQLTVGEPVGSIAIGDARRRLYETGLYSRVDIDVVPVAAVSADPTSAPAEGDRPVQARVRVDRRPRYSFRYGLQWSDEVVGPEERTQRFGLSADLENRNLFGSAPTVGVSARLRRDQQIGRVFLGASRFFGLPLRSNLFLSRSREDIGADGALSTVSDVTEISAEQTYRLRRFIDLRYGYGFGRNRTTIGGEGANFDVSVKVARLTTSGIVERRNDPFDPTRGWFTAATLETSREGLGSDINFLKSFLQYFQFVPIADKTVFASAVRLGLARTFEGEDLIPSERFFAGGATSVRGYREEDLGPRNIFDEASGGSALFIASGELRFPIHRWVRGVGFVDVGNVYDTIGDLSLSDLQVGTGAGVRLTTPIGLLRLDVALPANPRPFDQKWTAYVGLGHAF